MSLWKSKYLSLLGKVTLIKSTIVSTASYYMQGLLFPKGICNSLDKVVRNFFWDEHT